MTAYHMLGMLENTAGDRETQGVVRELVEGQVSWVKGQVVVWIVYCSVFVYW